MIAVFYATEGEIGREPLEGFSEKGKIELPEWQKGVHKARVRWGVYQGREIILAQTGIWREVPELGNTQAKEVAVFVLDKFPVEMVVIAGICGGLKRNLETGDLVICSPVHFEGQPSLLPDAVLVSLAAMTLQESGIRFRIGNNLTIPFFAWRLEDKKRIVEEHPEAEIVEMEDYFVALVAVSRKVPFLAVRAVGDTFREYDGGDEIVESFRDVPRILHANFFLPFLQRL